MPPKRYRPATFTLSFKKSAHRTNFNKIKDKQIGVTKFAFLPILEQFGWYQGVHFLLQKGGLHGMLQKDEITYHKPTLEFLSSLETCNVNGEKGITFQLHGRSRKMTYPAIAEAFGWTYNDVEWESPSENELRWLWYHLSGHMYEGDRTQRLSSVVHPCFRYVFRLIWQTILGIGEPGQIRTPQLRYFWPLCPEGTRVPNYVDVFVRRCQALVTEGGVIGMGGMVTLLAKHLGITLTEDDLQVNPTAVTSYDLNTLNVIGFVITDRSLPPYTHLMVHKYKSCLLPPPQAHLFVIPPNLGTSDLRTNFMDMYPVFIPPAAPQEEEPAQEAEEEHQGDVPPAISDENLWRQQMGAKLDRVQLGLDHFKDEMEQRWDVVDRRWEAMEARQDTFEAAITSRFDQLFINQSAMMDYFARTGGQNFVDPRYQATGSSSQANVMNPDEMRRQFEEQQHRHPGDYQGFPGSGSGPSGC